MDRTASFVTERSLEASKTEWHPLEAPSNKTIVVYYLKGNSNEKRFQIM